MALMMTRRVICSCVRRKMARGLFMRGCDVVQNKVRFCATLDGAHGPDTGPVLLLCLGKYIAVVWHVWIMESARLGL